MSGTVHLNRKLVLEDAVRVDDGAGGHTETWTVLGTLWASVKAGAGREYASQHLTLSKVGYRIIVRAAVEGAPSRPKPDQRFVDGSRVFRILAVSEHDSRGHYLMCRAREEVLA